MFMDDEDGRFSEPAYVPAYVRRYPFLLAKSAPRCRRIVALLRSDTSGAIGAYT